MLFPLLLPLLLPGPLPLPAVSMVVAAAVATPLPSLLLPHVLFDVAAVVAVVGVQQLGGPSTWW